MTDQTRTTETEAQAAVDQAAEALSKALEALREARGGSPQEPCWLCKGTGRDSLQALVGRDEPCEECEGSGQQRKRYPLIVHGVDFGDHPAIRRPLLHPNTTWVKVRPVNDKYEGRTYLGWMLGDIAQGISLSFHLDGRLHADLAHHNPAIFVPDLGTVIFGHSSWWAPVKSPDDLRTITDADINDVWYVKALKDLEGAIARSDAASANPGEGAA